MNRGERVRRPSGVAASAPEREMRAHSLSRIYVLRRSNHRVPKRPKDVKATGLRPARGALSLVVHTISRSFYANFALPFFFFNPLLFFSGQCATSREIQNGRIGALVRSDRDYSGGRFAARPKLGPRVEKLIRRSDIFNSRTRVCASESTATVAGKKSFLQ